MKNIVCIFLAVFFTIVGCAFQKAWSDDLLTRDQAITILVEQVINPSLNKDTLMAFGPQDMLASGDVVEPALLNTPPYAGSTKTIQTPTWFFWIDDEPKSDFVHYCRFVYIDAGNANPTIGDGITVETQGWWPKINGTNYYKLYQERVESDDFVYGELLTPG
jgi:hypothetical protein